MSRRDEPFYSKFDGSEIPGHAWVAAERMWAEDAYHERICDWLRANDVDPCDVPIWAPARVANGQLTIPVYTRSRPRYVTVDRNDPNRVLTHTITVPIKVQPNDDVELWLIGGKHEHRP